MQIKSFKYLGNDKYIVNIDDLSVILYEDTIVKNNILGKKNISEKEVKEYLDETSFYELYYKSIDYINKRLRSKLELKNYLNNLVSDRNLANNVYKKLIKDGYLNDLVYAKSYIHDAIMQKMEGPKKIKKYLLENGIDEDIIDEELKVYTKTIQQEKIKKYVDKQLRLNKKNSVFSFKEKVLSILVNQGFDRNLIIEYLESISFDDEEIKRKEYEKIYNKLKNKYSGKELVLKVKQKMYMKGFR